MLKVNKGIQTRKGLGKKGIEKDTRKQRKKRYCIWEGSVKAEQAGR